jgi:hypothetical protein
MSIFKNDVTVGDNVYTFFGEYQSGSIVNTIEGEYVRLVKKDEHLKYTGDFFNHISWTGNNKEICNPLIVWDDIMEEVRNEL